MLIMGHTTVCGVCVFSPCLRRLLSHWSLFLFVCISEQDEANVEKGTALLWALAI